MFKSFSIKFFITYTIVTLVMFVFIYYGFNYFLIERFADQAAFDLQKENQMILNDYLNLESFSYDAIEDTFEPLFRYSSHTIYLLDSQSRIIYLNRSSEKELLGKVIVDDLVEQALEGNTAQGQTTLGNTFTEFKIVVATPIQLHGQILGVILNTVEMPEISSSVQSISFAIFIIMLAILAITFTFSYFFSMKATKTINAFNTTAKKIASGQLSSRVELPYENNDVGDLAKNMNYMAEELERVDSMRREFIANVSHDLRTPLTSIGGFAQAMLDGTIPVENQDKYLKIVLAETEHLTNLTKNLLLLTQMENNVIKLDFNAFDIHSLLKKVLIQFEQPIVKKNLKVRLFVTDSELNVIGDLNQIQRVIYNLIDNAIKFSPEQGTLILETKVRQNKAYISISDTGPGMSKEEIKYMWIRFHKGDKSRNKEKGFGIGLSIVREIINAHHQTVDVYSQLGKGTTFIFTLDLAEEHLN